MMKRHLRIRAHRRGFTLIELVIVVAVMAILAAIVYPSFIVQIRQGRRSDAVQALAALQQAQERWRGAHASYAANGVLTTAWPDGLGLGARSAGSHYDLAIASNPAPTASGYTATATAATGSSQAADSAGSTSCATLTLTVDRGNAAHTPAACWSR